LKLILFVNAFVCHLLIAPEASGQIENETIDKLKEWDVVIDLRKIINPIKSTVSVEPELP
jgi:hypothetical protein